MSPAAEPAAIDAALAVDLLADQFPDWAGLPVRPAEPQGWDNRTFRIGDHLTARLPSAAGYALQVEKEWEWLPRLAPVLPLPVPERVALGRPGAGYPFPWSVGRWREGVPVAVGRIADTRRFAQDLAAFLAALRRADATGGPAPGPHSSFRGAHPSVYGEEVEHALAGLAGEVPVGALHRMWDAALASRWESDPVWLHGDVAAGNLLLDGGHLAAVLDFGCSAVGDPACDLVIAWTVLPRAARDEFRATIGLGAATWSRGRGWLLWKALIVLEAALEADDAAAAAGARRDLLRVLGDADD